MANPTEKVITLKARNLKALEKRFRNRGEFRYNIIKPAHIPKGHPKLCYDRTSAASTSGAHTDHQQSQPVSSNLVFVQEQRQGLQNTQRSSTSADHDDLPIERQVPIDHVDEEPFLSEVELYFHVLKQKKAISIYGDHGKLLVIKDFWPNKKCLQPDRFVLIERRCARFINGNTDWIHWCSCDETKARQVSSLEVYLNTTINEFHKHYPDCIHIKVSRLIFNHYDLIHEIQPMCDDYTEGEDHEYSMAGSKLYEVPDSKIICCGGKGISRYGLVDLGRNRLLCLTCSSFECDHVSIIKCVKLDGSDSIYYDLIQSITNVNSDSADGTKVYKPKLISFKKIQFQRSQNLTDGLEALKTLQGILLPDLDSCQNCGSTLLEGNPVSEDWVAYDNVTVITNTSIKYAKVFYRPCSSCDVISIFEGQSKCLLNLGTYLVGYDVLRSYMHSFLHGRRPLYTFYQTWCDVHLDYGNSNIQDVFSYQKLRHAWNSFMKLLDIDFSTGFNCSMCDGDHGYPETIICDGTSLSFQRRMWEWKEQKSADVLNLSSTRFSDRVFLQDASLRSLLKRYASGGEATRKIRLKQLDEKEKNLMFSEIMLISPSLYQILKCIELDKSLFKIYQPLLLCLSSPSPVCVLLKPVPDVQNLLTLIGKDINLKENPVLWTLLHKKIPILFEILEQTNPSNELKCLLQELWNVAITPFINAIEDNSELSQPEDELSFFPHLPKVRDRGQYQMDNHKGKQRKKEDNCNKNYGGHPSLLPGIFTVYCPHGVCYGFQVMESNESPNVPFTILKTRFKRAPKVVIYDNACKLQEYCLSRDPLFFQETEFYIDRLHWDNHTSCSLAYNLSIYPQFDKINSQINEQANSCLKRIKDQLSYMTADHFMAHCSLYLWNRNQISGQTGNTENLTMEMV